MLRWVVGVCLSFVVVVVVIYLLSLLSLLSIQLSQVKDSRSSVVTHRYRGQRMVRENIKTKTTFYLGARRFRPKNTRDEQGAHPKYIGVTNWTTTVRPSIPGKIFLGFQDRMFRPNIRVLPGVTAKTACRLAQNAPRSFPRAFRNSFPLVEGPNGFLEGSQSVFSGG